jgi:CRP-like cAMP-binding protein
MQGERSFRSFLAKFVELTDFEFDNIIRPKVVVRSFARKETISKAGEVEDYFNFIVSGMARKFYMQGAEDFTVQISYEGHLIHCQESFHSRNLSEYYIDAIEPVVLISISYLDFERILTSSQKMEHMGRVIMTQMFILKDRWQMQLVMLNAKERFLGFISANPIMMQRVPQKILASYLNIKPETFSRFKHLLRNAKRLNN